MNHCILPTEKQSSTWDGASTPSHDPQVEIRAVGKTTIERIGQTLGMEHPVDS